VQNAAGLARRNRSVTCARSISKMTDCDLLLNLRMYAILTSFGRLLSVILIKTRHRFSYVVAVVLRAERRAHAYVPTPIVE